MAAATMKPRLGELPVAKITEDDVAAWVTWLEFQPSPRCPGSTYSTKMIRNHHGFLSPGAGQGGRWQPAHRDSRAGYSDHPPTRTGMVVLTQSEFVTLLHFVPEHWRPLVTWLAGTGMRWGEATALTWRDLDTDTRTSLVHVTKA